jgi:hypothetical protein
MTRSTGPLGEQRWIGFINKSKYTVPAFGLIQLPPMAGYVTKNPGESREDQFYTHEISGGEMLLHGYRPNSYGVATQNYAMFAANGPAAVAPGARGMCTQDWPARVLISLSEDVYQRPGNTLPAAMYPNGVAIGPWADNWSLKSGGGAFVLQSRDASRPLVSAPSVNNVGWVVPSPLPLTFPMYFEGIGGTHENGDAIATFTPAMLSYSLYLDKACRPYQDTDPAGRHGLEFTADGHYMVHFAANGHSHISSGTEVVGVTATVWSIENAFQSFDIQWSQQSVHQDTVYGVSVSDTYRCFNLTFNLSAMASQRTVVSFINNSTEHVVYSRPTAIVSYMPTMGGRRGTSGSPNWYSWWWGWWW